MTHLMRTFAQLRVFFVFDEDKKRQGQEACQYVARETYRNNWDLIGWMGPRVKPPCVCVCVHVLLLEEWQSVTAKVGSVQKNNTRSQGKRVRSPLKQEQNSQVKVMVESRLISIQAVSAMVSNCQ